MICHAETAALVLILSRVVTKLVRVASGRLRFRQARQPDSVHGLEVGLFVRSRAVATV
jgi:hypothetical protein